MIISVRDIENDILDAASITGLLAGITSICRSKKTLAMQFTNPTKDSILNVLSGRDLRNSSIREMFAYTDDGLDGLLMRAETTELQKEHYDECVTALINKENMLDVLNCTNRDGYLMITTAESIKNVIISAKKVYDYIYIMIDGSDKKLVELTTSITDEDLIIIPQGKKVSPDLSNKKTHLIVKDFEAESRFDVKSVKKAYGVNRVYVQPHNVNFRDSVISQTLLDLILVNKDNVKSDENYTFMDSLFTLVSRYVVNVDDEDDEPESKLKTKEQKEILMAEPTTGIPSQAVQEVKVKKGFFRRKKTHIMIDKDFL